MSGVKYKNEKWCKRCRRLVIAVKVTHGLRNGVAAASVPLMGVGVLLAKREPWQCPHCQRKV